MLLASRCARLAFPGAWLLKGPWCLGSGGAWVASHGMNHGAWRGGFQGAKVLQAVHGPRDPVRAGTQVPSLHQGASCQGNQGRSITLAPGWLANPGTQGVKRPWHQGTNMPRCRVTFCTWAPGGPHAPRDPGVGSAQVFGRPGNRRGWVAQGCWRLLRLGFQDHEGARRPRYPDACITMCPGNQGFCMALGPRRHRDQCKSISWNRFTVETCWLGLMVAGFMGHAGS